MRHIFIFMLSGYLKEYLKGSRAVSLRGPRGRCECVGREVGFNVQPAQLEIDGEKERVHVCGEEWAEGKALRAKGRRIRGRR